MEPHGYSQQFALRQLKPASNGEQQAAKKTRKLLRQATGKQETSSTARGASSRASKTLMDAFKQHGMRLCDGSRLNAVGKGILSVGRVPPSVSVHITALYLSQNNLHSLEGIDQFAGVRLLSVGGNLLACSAEIARLAGLPQLRNLNLMGNPICDQPNYRLRIIDALKQIQVLDNADVSKKEREIAPRVAAQDEALRAMVTQNHFDIQKLQHIAHLIPLHKEFYGRVLAGVCSGKFDRVPSPSEAACNVPLLQRLWRYEDALSTPQREALELQMLTIITRTHGKLGDHPKVKAKEYLLKIANATSPRAQQAGGLSSDVMRRCASWEEAYSNVIALQQKTIINLQGLCERQRREMVDFLKDLLSTDPRIRKQMLGRQRVQDDRELETKPPLCPNPQTSQHWMERHAPEEQRCRDIGDGSMVQHQLPPQQQDPEVWEGEAVGPHQHSFSQSNLTEQPKRYTTAAETRPAAGKERTVQALQDRKAYLRSGDFANKSLGEAIHGFTLRDSVMTPPLKPSKAMPLQVKPPQVHHVYPANRPENFPLPPDIAVKQRPPFPTHSRNPRRVEPPCQDDHSPDFRDVAREIDRSHRAADATTEFSYDGRRVSSAFTREDLDLTSISGTSCVSSPPRQSRRADRVDVPSAKPTTDLRTEVAAVPASTGIHTPLPQTSQRTQLNTRGRISPQDTVENPPQPVSAHALVSDSRLQELEQREEKYIRALMQSEQRELDLRNNLAGVQRTLTSYQHTLAQQLHEREAIKEEVVQRTMAVATPKILTRFFVRWIRFYNWSQQLKHIQKKRCFIVQHDRFWQWRRKIWVQQELRECVRKQQRRLCWQHFTEWMNVTRVSVIAKRAGDLRQTRFLKDVLRGWVEAVVRIKNAKKFQQEQHNETLQKLQRMCFREWRRISRYKQTIKKMQGARWQDSLRTNKQVAFWNWKLFLFSVARPIRERSTCFLRQVQTRKTRQHFEEWHKLVKVDKLHDARLRQRVWRSWVAWRRRLQSESDAALKAKMTVVSMNFSAWRATATEQIATRRSLSLAKRYVNRRRLRKLWAYWKYFSIAKRKYTQGSTKALKHYFIKLLRNSWNNWKQQAHVNLQKAKAKKYGALQQHFDAFRDGIRFVVAEKARGRMLAHMKKRWQRVLLRQCMGSWGSHTAKKKSSKRNAQQISRRRGQAALSEAWHRWRDLRVNNLCRQMLLLRKSCEAAVQEKHDLEANLLAAKDTGVSLSDQMEFLNEHTKDQEQQVADLQQRLRHSEEHNASLESELKIARSAVERERHAWEGALCEEEEKREADSRKYRSLAQENQVLQVRTIELQRELEVEKSKVTTATRANEDVRGALETVGESHRSELAAAANRHKELEQEIADLRGYLKEQETEREDTANRLQEYEKRIASTCEAMNEHEKAHERESERLRDKHSSVEAKWKEEQARNAELSRLIREKNQLILDMTSRVEVVERASRPDRSAMRCDGDLPPGNQNECGATVQLGSCSNQSAHPAAMRSSLSVFNQSVATRAEPPTGRNGRVPLSRLSSAIRANSKLGPSYVATEATAQAEERMIDEHTNKVHEDIRLLQERISRRLEQVPACVPQNPRPMYNARSAFSRDQKSPRSSCTSLSDEESDSTVENVGLNYRARRARLLRLQIDKKSAVMAASPAVAHTTSRLARRTSTLKERKNGASLANTLKRGKEMRCTHRGRLVLTALTDPSATLAAISARLAIVIPPAESEIARINREALATVARRAYNARNPGFSPQTAEESDDGDVTALDVSRQHVQPSSNSTSSSSPTKSGVIPSLHDSIIAEEWVNLHLEASGTFLLPASDIAPMLKNGDVELDVDEEAFAFRKGGDGGPLARAGIDRFSLYRIGMPKDLVDRLYRALYVYTNGFHNIINEIAAHCPPRVERHVSSNVWLSFLLLLEQCEGNKYEMAMLKFKQAAQSSQKQMQDAFHHEKMDLEALLRIVNSKLSDEAARSSEKSELIKKLATESTASNLMQQRAASQAEQIRLLKLEILEHEDEAKKLNEFLDDARKDYEVANSERLNAMTERFALEEEIRQLSTQLERVEAEKANYARRMHETLFMNQALRSSSDQLKQDIVALNMEKTKANDEKQVFHDQLGKAQLEIRNLEELKAQVDKELAESQRKQGHLEARQQTMKEQFEIEVENNAKHVKEMARLAVQIEEERVQVGVWEAKCNLLTAEKQNTGMRAQDKLRIERLLNQKIELEAAVETNKLDRKRDEEQIYNLRSALNALDAEMQHSKRVFSAGQQAFLHSERTGEQLRQQNQELEKTYEKAKKKYVYDSIDEAPEHSMGNTERFKLYEANSKEQITKLEVEVKVANAQLREVTYVSRDNAAQIDNLTKALTLAGRETTVLKARIETSEKQFTELQNEKEDLQRDKKQLDLASSTSKNALSRFILSLQNMLALVKLDEFPLDEAIRELLQMVMDTFGEELDIEDVLDEDDKPKEIELEIHEDVEEEERVSRQRRDAARRKGIIKIEGLRGEEEEEDEVTALELPKPGVVAEGQLVRRATARMSQFRKSKLDHLVNKLQRDLALKTELIESLESIVRDQSTQVSHLTLATKRQTRLLVLDECQKGMLVSDLETMTLVLFNVRAEKQATQFLLEQTRIDHVLQTNRAFQAEVALATLRRESDMQIIVYEDLQAKIWREYEHTLYMRSLRREKEVQATVMTADQFSQTLVPHRNPAMERPRMSSLYIPSNPPGSSETLVQKISRAARELLPGVASDMNSIVSLEGKSKKTSRSHKSKPGLVKPLVSSPRAGRPKHRAQASQSGHHRRSRSPELRGAPTSINRGGGASTLPLLDDSPIRAAAPSRIVHHVNEFGTRQDVLISPVYPPFFNASVQTVDRTELSPRPPAHPSPHLRSKSMPRKIDVDKRLPANHLQLDTHYDERVDPARYPRANERQARRQPGVLPTDRAPPPSGSTASLRYNRSFLRAGMEVLRNAGSNGSPLPYPGEVDGQEDDEDSSFSDDQRSRGPYGNEEDGESEEDMDEESGSDDEYGREQEMREALQDQPQSPSRLAAVVSGYRREQISQQESARQAQLQSPRRFVLESGRVGSGHKGDEVRKASEDDVGELDVDSELADETRDSPFTTAVLYPILPQQ
ncbi:hypothetical protein BBJ28_00009864 [Nothophytophthora sp. Chile5]|nr:hypothetical protein BBJ28_00009864 [Nothophytophthora sp. Chile5]